MVNIDFRSWSLASWSLNQNITLKLNLISFSNLPQHDHEPSRRLVVYLTQPKLVEIRLTGGRYPIITDSSLVSDKDSAALSMKLEDGGFVRVAGSHISIAFE
jgi:hypothetical protein